MTSTLFKTTRYQFSPSSVERLIFVQLLLISTHCVAAPVSTCLTSFGGSEVTQILRCCRGDLLWTAEASHDGVSTGRIDLAAQCQSFSLLFVVWTVHFVSSVTAVRNSVTSPIAIATLAVAEESASWSTASLWAIAVFLIFTAVAVAVDIANDGGFVISAVRSRTCVRLVARPCWAIHLINPIFTPDPAVASFFLGTAAVVAPKSSWCTCLRSAVSLVRSVLAVNPCVADKPIVVRTSVSRKLHWKPIFKYIYTKSTRRSRPNRTCHG